MVGVIVVIELVIFYVLVVLLSMIIVNMLVGGIIGVLVIVFGIKCLVFGLGIFDLLIGLMSSVGLFYLVLVIGFVLNILFIIVLKGLWLCCKVKVV